MKTYFIINSLLSSFHLEWDDNDGDLTEGDNEMTNFAHD